MLVLKRLMEMSRVKKSVKNIELIIKVKKTNYNNKQ